MMYRRTIRLAMTALLAASAAHAQHDDLSIYSTASGGGALAVVGPLEEKVLVTPRLPFCPGGICPYSATDLGFVTPAADQPGGGLRSLNPGTQVSFVLVAIDAFASVKIGTTVLADAGESASLGAATGLHVHPEWQVSAPEGQRSDYPLQFRLTTSSPAYDDSIVYTLTLTNDPTGSGASPTPSATALPPSATPSGAPVSATPTPAETASAAPTTTVSAVPERCAGDCNGDGSVTVNELITGVNLVLDGASPEACAALDRDGNDEVSIGELIQGVNRALAGC
jgi:hypothetical protein